MHKVSIRSIRRTKELCVRRHVFSHHAPAITASTSWQLARMRAVATRSVPATPSRMSPHAVRCPLWTCSSAGSSPAIPRPWDPIGERSSPSAPRTSSAVAAVADLALARHPPNHPPRRRYPAAPECISADRLSGARTALAF